MNPRPTFFLVALLLLAGVNSIAQDEAHGMRQALEHYGLANLQEKVFAHTDRTFYLTGDHLWLKLYVADGSFNTPLDLSKVAYVEILDNQNHSVVQGKLALKEGFGHTTLFLPSSLNSGKYILRAYTRWMKNYSPDFYFHKTITIVNPFKPLGLQERAAEKKYDVQFFPEGGHLVSGLSGKVGFRVADQSGKGLKAFDGLIVNQDSDTVTAFEPLRFGLGSFELTPREGEEYRAVIRDTTGLVISVVNLPPARDTGYVLSVRDKNSDTIIIGVGSNFPPTETPEPVSVVLHSRLASIIELSGRPVNGKISFEVQKTELMDGITHITLFDAKDKPVCERLYFKTPEKLLRIYGKTDKPLVPGRSKIALSLATADDRGVPVSANLSVAVFRLDSLQHKEDQDIVNYLLLSGDLPGTIESPSYYVSGAGDAAVCADNLMLTHGWRRFAWTDVLGSPEKPLLEPEYRGHLITGRLVNATDGQPASGIPVYLSVPGRRFHFTGTKSKANGELIFELADFYGPGSMILQTNWTRDSTYRIIPANPFSEEFSDRILVQDMNLDKRIQSTLLSRSISMQVENAYLEEQKNRPKSLDVDTLAFYRTPDQRYYLDDFTRFGVMEEVMREYVSAVMVRKRKQDFYFRTVNTKTNELFTENPLVLLDGVPVFDINAVMAYDPLKVWRLDVVANRYYYGKLSFSGIASFLTYAGNLPDFPLDERALVTRYDGMNRQREFYSPVYEVQQQVESRIPDFRTLLYWAPDVQTGEDGDTTLTFYSGDLPGKYLISVQGLTKTGIPGTTSLILEVTDREDD
jgi:hypothetical protein